MSKRPPAFQIYHDDMKAISYLSRPAKGHLLELLDAYASGETINEEEIPQKIRQAFNFMSQRIAKDTEAYNSKVEKTRKASQARWNANNADACRRMQTDADACNITQLNSTKHNSTKNKNNALEYAQRVDDMNDVLMDV